MKQIVKLYFFIFLFLFSNFHATNAQDPNRFNDEVDKLFTSEYNFSTEKKLVVLTGSSSLRMWTDVQDYYPQYNVINNGFGGSQFSDLIYFYDKLITNQKPDYLFIYEGDNDIAENKKASKIYRDFKILVEKIKADLPDTKVIFISPKPSIARWNLKKEYKKVNKKISRYCNKKNDNVEFANVWPAMLDDDGKLYPDIFIEDGLHMNKKGYDLWNVVLSAYMKDS